MNSAITFSTFEIINIVFHLLTLVIVGSLFVSTHKGDCRGVVVSKKQNPDGYWVTREAKQFQILRNALNLANPVK